MATAAYLAAFGFRDVPCWSELEPALVRTDFA